RIDDGLEEQVDETPAALAEARAERKPAQRVRPAAGQKVACNRNGLVLEMAASDRAVDGGGGDDHLRPGLARRRAPRRRHGDDDRGLSAVAQAHEYIDPMGHRPTPAAFACMLTTTSPKQARP